MNAAFERDEMLRINERLIKERDALAQTLESVRGYCQTEYSKAVKNSEDESDFERGVDRGRSDLGREVLVLLGELPSVSGVPPHRLDGKEG